MKISTFFFLFFINVISSAQNINNLNCLEINDQAMSVYQTNPDLALQLLKKAKVKAISSNDNELISLTLNNFAILIRMKGKFLESKKLSIQALKGTKKSTTIASIDNNLGACNRNLGLYNESIKNYLQALKFYEKSKDLKKEATVNNNIGMVFSTLEQFEKAKSYHKTALNLFETINDKKGLSESYNNYAIALATQDSLNESIIYFRKSLKIEEFLKDKKGIAESLNNVGEVHYYLRKIDSALFYYQKSAEIELQLKNYSGVSESYNNIAQVYIELKQLTKAKKFIDNAYNYSLQSKEIQIILTSLENYKNYYESIGDFKQANIKIQQFYALKDSVQKISEVKDINELETKYQTAKKEKQIIEQQAEAKQKNIYLLGLGLLVLLASLISFLIYKQQKQKNQQQAQENQLKLVIEKIENQNKLQEQRLAISRDLHDNIGSQLTFIISSVENVKYGFDITNQKLDNKLTNISSFAKDTILELRDTIWAMNSNEISYEDLEIRINNFIEKAKLSQENISFSFAIDENLKQQKLSSVEGMNVYRTIQEAINNSLKYAAADVISVNIKPIANQTCITIKDNGKGFDLETTEKGNGLNNMKKRIEEIDGTFDLKSSKNGTKIEILIDNA